MPGRLVLDKTIPVESPADSLNEVGIDLSQVMDGKFGQFIVVVTPPKGMFPEDQYWRIVQAWVQVTQIGLDAFADHSEMVAWATDLTDGAPLSGISIQAGPGGVKNSTGEGGIARFNIPSGATYLVASKGADQALLPRSMYFWDDETWSQRSVDDEPRWYVFDDRQMYRPGDEVHVKGWLRRRRRQTGRRRWLVGKAVTGVHY
jgi:uncharacterized protein YfaS (alpha-2-macroglobulin family)